MQVVVELFFHEVADEFGYRRAVFAHIPRAELCLCLRFEYRFFHFYGYGGDHAVAYVGVFEVFSIELLYRAGDGFAERCKVCASLRGVLAVDKRIEFLAVLCGVGDNHFYVLTREMDYRIKRLVGHTVFQQVEQSIA